MSDYIYYTGERIIQEKTKLDFTLFIIVLNFDYLTEGVSLRLFYLVFYQNKGSFFLESHI